MTDCWINLDITAYANKSLQDFYNDFIPSRKIQHLLIQNKQILLDGKNVTRNALLNGKILSIKIYNSLPKHYNSDLDIVYEDELLLIVNKPCGIIVHSDGTDSDNLTRQVNEYLPEAIAIHRLDKETSGLVIYSKSAVFQPILDKMISERAIECNYLAFCNGLCVNKTSFTINNPISKDRHVNNKMIVNKNGMEAITKVKVLKLIKQKNITIFKCTLQTGRTHQIRVHLSHHGFPIINDSLYGTKNNCCSSMGLVSYEIILPHPLTKQQICIKANLPVDLADLTK